MTVKSLAQVATEHLPPDWADGERWLARRLNRKELRGVRYGRTWVMRDSDIDYMLTKYGNEVTAPEVPVTVEPSHPVNLADGLSPRSRRRLRSAS